MKCPYCSQEILDASAFCEHCGGAMVVIGAAVGAVFGGALRAARAAIGQRVKGERGATVRAIVGGLVG